MPSYPGRPGNLPNDVLIIENLKYLESYDQGTYYDLPAETVVMISDTVNIGSHYLKLNENTVLRGNSHSSIVSTNTGGVVRCSDLTTNVIIREVNIIAPAGPCLSLSGPITAQLNLFFVGLIGATAGTITGFDVQALKDCFIQCAAGLTLTGTTNKIFVSACPFYGTTAGNASITLDASLDADIVDIQSSFFKSEAGTAIKAEAGYTVGEGVISDSLVLGATTLLDGLTPSDVNWSFRGNTGVRDSMTVGESHSTASATVTITTIDTPVRAANASASGDNIERFTNDETSGLTYTGARPATVLVTATVQVDPDGNNVSGNLYLAKNNTPITASAVPFFVSTGGDRRTVTISDLVSMETDDTVSVWVDNDTNTNNILVTNVSLIAKA